MGDGIDIVMRTSVMLSFLTTILSVIGALILPVTVVIILLTIRKKQNNNSNSPVLTVSARVVAKRTNDWTRFDNFSLERGFSATFMVQSGDRMILNIDKNAFMQLNEGDMGWLTFQGARYLKFTRF